MNILKSLSKKLSTKEMEEIFDLYRMGVRENISHMVPSPKTVEMFEGISDSLVEIAKTQKRESIKMFFFSSLFIVLLVLWVHFYLPITVERVVLNMELIEIDA